MNAAPHMPSAYLILPEQGEATLRDLQAHARKVALARLMTHPLSLLTPELRRALPPVRRLLGDLARQQPALLFEALASPDVLPALLIAEVGPDLTGQSPDAMFRAAVPPLLAVLAHKARAAVRETVLWDVPVTVLSDPLGHRLFRFDPPARGLVLDPMGLEIALTGDRTIRVPAAPAGIEGVDGVVTERPFHPLHPELPRLQFAMYDSNPLSMYEAHPEKFGNAISLGDRPLSDWLTLFREALDLIKLTLPTWFEELKSTQRRFVPVGYLPERHLSASYREAPGIAYLTLCDHVLTVAEAMVHETQHTKANLLSFRDPIVHNGMTAWTKSPVRPDLRPLWGVLLAVHAFVPVSALHERLATLDHPIARSELYVRRRYEVLQGNHRGMGAVLETADATALGQRMIDEMRALHETIRLRTPPAPADLVLDPDLLPPS